MATRRPALLSLDDHVALLDRFDDDDQAVKDRLHELILARTEYDVLTGCLVYTGYWDRQSGQAKMRLGCNVYPLSRLVAWVYKRGFRIWGVERAVRTCDTPACCNPAHVRTVADCAAAMAAQRASRRLGDARVKLSPAKAVALRGDAAAGMSLEMLEAKYALKRRAVRMVLSGRTYQGVL